MTSPHLSDGYAQVLERHGLTEDQVQRSIASQPLPVANHAVDSAFKVAPSAIHGLGMVATRPLVMGETFPAVIKDQRTNLARYVNHSDFPNAVAYLKPNGDVDVRVLFDLPQDSEVTMDYNENLKTSQLRKTP